MQLVYLHFFCSLSRREQCVVNKNAHKLLNISKHYSNLSNLQATPVCDNRRISIF